MSYSNKHIRTETCVFVKISKKYQTYCRRENGVDTLKFNHGTLLKTLKKLFVIHFCSTFYSRKLFFQVRSIRRNSGDIFKLDRWQSNSLALANAPRVGQQIPAWRWKPETNEKGTLYILWHLSLALHSLASSERPFMLCHCSWTSSWYKL